MHAFTYIPVQHWRQLTLSLSLLLRVCSKWWESTYYTSSLLCPMFSEDWWQVGDGLCTSRGSIYLPTWKALGWSALPTTQTNPTTGYQHANLIMIDFITFVTCCFTCCASYELQVIIYNLQLWFLHCATPLQTRAKSCWRDDHGQAMNGENWLLLTDEPVGFEE